MADIKRLPNPSSQNWGWQEQGACHGSGTDAFFHPEFERGASRERRVASAKEFCGRCPVLQQCREHALAVEEPYGTWGGLDELERRSVIRSRRRRVRAG